MSDEDIYQDLPSLYHVPITKIKKADGSFETIEVEVADLSEATVHALIGEALKLIINARMSGPKVGAVTKLTGKELTSAQANARKIAQENLADIQAGNLKHSRGKAKSTIPAAVKAEAMRLAKTAIKDWVRNNGFKPSQFDEKAYTAKAKEYVEHDPAYLEQARQNIEARKTPSFAIKLDITELGPQKAKKAKDAELPAGITAKPSVQTAHRPTNMN